MHKFEPKKNLTLHYKNYYKIEYRSNSSQKAPNTTLQTISQEKRNHKFEPKKAHNTTLQKLCQKT